MDAPKGEQKVVIDKHCDEYVVGLTFFKLFGWIMVSRIPKNC